MSTSVMDFGAVGDGTTNDTSAIQDALDSGEEIFFPRTANYYKITDTLTISNAGTVLVGEGMPEIRQTTASKVGIQVSVSECSIIGLKITGYQHASSNGNEVAIQVGGASAGNCAHNIRIKECDLSNWGYAGIVCEFVEEFEISGNKVYDCYYTGIQMRSAKNGIIDGNVVKDIIANGTVGTGAYGIVLTKTDGSSATYPVSNNIRVSKNYLSGITTWKAIDTHGGFGLVITENEIEDCYLGIALGSYMGTEGSEQGPQNCIVSNNRLYVNHGSGEVISRANSGVGITAGGDSASILAVNNIVSGNLIDGFGNAETSGNNYAVGFDYSVETSFTGNIIKNSGYRAIRMNVANTKFLVDGNIIDGLDASGSAGIYLANTGQTGTISNNRLEVGALVGIYAHASSSNSGINCLNNEIVTSGTYRYTNPNRIGLIDPLVEDTYLWNPASISSGSSSYVDITSAGIPGMADVPSSGCYVVVGYDRDLQGLVLHCWISAAGTARLKLYNFTGSSIDIAETTFFIKVVRRD